jgi:hypothetical protein
MIRGDRNASVFSPVNPSYEAQIAVRPPLNLTSELSLHPFPGPYYRRADIYDPLLLSSLHACAMFFVGCWILSRDASQDLSIRAFGICPLERDASKVCASACPLATFPNQLEELKTLSQTFTSPLHEGLIRHSHL